MVHHRLYINKTYCNIYNNILKTKLLKRQVELQTLKKTLKRDCEDIVQIQKNY